MYTVTLSEYLKHSNNKRLAIKKDFESEIDAYKLFSELIVPYITKSYYGIKPVTVKMLSNGKIVTKFEIN